MSDEADEHEQENVPSERVVYTLPKGKRCEIRAVVRLYEGQQLAELRVFLRKADGSWMPTRRGVSVTAGRADELLGAAHALAEAARGTGP